MNVKSILLIYLKELKELLRSAGLVFVMVVFPMIIYPVAVSFSSGSTDKEIKRINSSVSNICIHDTDKLLPNLKEFLESDNMVKVSEKKFDSISKECNAIINVSKSPDLFGTGWNNIEIYIRYDSTDKLSQKTEERLVELIQDLKKEIIFERLDSKGLSEDMIEPISFESVNEASKERIFESMLGDMLPFIVIIMIISGAMQIAVDLTAGEKDRKTIQTLLMTPVGRKEIAVAKMLVVSTASFANCLINLIAIAISFKFMPKSVDVSIASSISPSSCFIALLLFIPFILFISSLFIALGFSAKNQVEAGIFTMPVVMIGMISGISVSSLDISSINIVSSLIPFYGTAASIKMIFASSINFMFIFINSLSCFVYTFILAFIVSKLFACEAIAFSGISDIFIGWLRKLKL